MRTIYEPAGRAGEYAELALNLYWGCEGQCDYCYVPAVVHIGREDFGSGSVPRAGVLEALRAEVYRRSGRNGRNEGGEGGPDRRPVLMCFTSDPYPRRGSEVTREAIRILGEAGMRPCILTKNGEEAARDFDLLERYGGQFGVTMVFDDDRLRLKYEVGAGCTSARYGALIEAHRRGIFTWVSVEPVIDADEAIRVIEVVSSHADLVRIGQLNYMPAPEGRIDWGEFGRRARRTCEEWGVQYYLKESLRLAMGEL